MNVSVANDGVRAVVRLDGRLDAEWAEQLSQTLTDLLESGTRSVILELSQVSYASSAAATLLARRSRDFAALRGELLLVSPPVESLGVLRHAGLGEHILQLTRERADTDELRADLERREDFTREWASPAPVANRSFDGRFEVTPGERGATLVCRLHGRPDALVQGMRAEDCEVVCFNGRSFGVGVGAIGDSQGAAGERMGEMVSAAGIVAYLPTEGARVPDYVMGTGAHGARAVVASAVVCEGSFSQLARFATGAESPGVSLSAMSEVLLAATGGEALGFVMVAESVGLVGAWLRRSPVGGDERPAFRPRELRSWLSLSAEPTHTSSTALVVGVVARDPPPALASHLRPADRDARLHAHAHAVVFSYTPAPQRTMTPGTVVASLFEQQRIRGVMHLLRDDRPGIGAGESVFRRGLIWTAPIGRVMAGGAA